MQRASFDPKIIGEVFEEIRRWKSRGPYGPRLSRWAGVFDGEQLSRAAIDIAMLTFELEILRRLHSEKLRQFPDRLAVLKAIVLGTPELAMLLSPTSDGTINLNPCMDETMRQEVFKIASERFPREVEK